MKTIAVLLTACALLTGCGTGFPVAAFTVGAVGTAINVENKGGTISGDDTIDGITDGFKKDSHESFELND